jgi:hypothetical protein
MLSRGSEWRRWEPHIHAPGTVMNNQFSGPNAWGDYLTALEQATPVIEAIAVTDYYVTDTYEEVLRHKATGRLPSAKGRVRVTCGRAQVSDKLSRQRRSMPQVRATPPMRPSVSACRLPG